MLGVDVDARKVGKDIAEAIFAAPNPGGSKQIPAEASIAKELNDPKIPVLDKAALAFPDTPEGKQAMPLDIPRE